MTFDGHATNKCALESLKEVTVFTQNADGTPGPLRTYEGPLSHTVGIRCKSHHFDLVGAKYTVAKKEFNRCKAAIAAEFSSHLNGIFSAPGSCAKTLFKVDFGLTPRHCNAVRWWAHEELDAFFLNYFRPTLEREITLADWVKKMVLTGELNGVHIAYLFRTLVVDAEGFDESFLCAIEIQLAATVDFTKKIIEATYLLEADIPMALVTYDILHGVQQDLDLRFFTMDYPNVNKFADEFAARRVNVPDTLLSSNEAWKDSVRVSLQLGYDYFMEDIMTDECISVFKAVRICNPFFFAIQQNWQTVPSLSASLRAFIRPLVLCRFIDNDIIDSLLDELPLYKTESELHCLPNLVNPKISELVEQIRIFWNSRKKKLPHWYDFVTLCMLLQPSSASVERLFSMLKFVFGDYQHSSLNDKVVLSVQLRYNHRYDDPTLDI